MLSVNRQKLGGNKAQAVPNAIISQLKVELGHFLSNPTLFLIFVLAPIFYGLFYAYPYSAEVPRKVPVAVVDLDRTKSSRGLSQMLDSAENTRVSCAAASFEEARDAFFERQAYGILIIPEGFQRKLLRGEAANLPLYTDGSYLLYYKQSFTAVQTVAATMGAGVTLQRLAALGAGGAAAQGVYTAVTLNSTALYNPVGGYATYVLPAVFVLICHQILIAGISMSTADECNHLRFYGNIAPPYIRLSAKLLFYMYIAVLQSLFLFCVTLPLFKIPCNGWLPDILLLLLPFYLAVILIGIILGSLLRFSGSSIIYVATTSIPLLFISGVPWSKLAMPQWVQALRVMLPSTHGIEGFVRVFREGASLAEVSGSVFSLWLIVAVLMPVALYRIKQIRCEM
ncbi:ABC transporter permease [Desulfovibrio sp. OttesenSCG-928-F07]|nr:ABC transporter permease [Desulfovibrio sp. OttesenSCG-928-F07]